MTLITTRHMSKFLYSLCSVLLLISTGLQAQQTNIPQEEIVELDRIVAIVNDDAIMDSELVTRIRKVRQELLVNQIPPPPTHLLEKQVLERLVLQRLQIQEAIRVGINVEDEALNRTIQKIAAGNELTLNQFRRLLERDGFSFSQFREDVRNEIMIGRVRNRMVKNRVKVSDQEIDHLLENLENAGELSTQYRVGHILIAVPEASNPDAVQGYREKAERIINELRNGADFSQTAAANSDAQTALEGGDLGWRKRSELPTAFADLIPKMSVGQVSDAIKTPGGLHVIKLMETRGGEQMLVTQTRVRHILMKPSEVLSDAEARSRIEHLKNRVESGEDFVQLAKSNSHDTASAIDGGDLGWVLPGRLEPNFEDVMDGTPIGQVSEPFPTQFGWHILKVEERREYDSTQEFRRNKARDIIRKRKVEEDLELWIRRLRDEAYVDFRLEQAPTK